MANWSLEASTKADSTIVIDLSIQNILYYLIAFLLLSLVLPKITLEEEELEYEKHYKKFDYNDGPQHFTYRHFFESGIIELPYFFKKVHIRSFKTAFWTAGLQM